MTRVEVEAILGPPKAIVDVSDTQWYFWDGAGQERCIVMFGGFASYKAYLPKGTTKRKFEECRIR